MIALSESALNGLVIKCRLWRLPVRKRSGKAVMKITGTAEFPKFR